MYVPYYHLSVIKRAYNNLHTHFNHEQKEEIQKVLHHSIGYAHNITPTYAPYSELFKEDI